MAQLACKRGSAHGSCATPTSTDVFAAVAHPLCSVKPADALKDGEPLILLAGGPPLRCAPAQCCCSPQTRGLWHA